MTVFLMFTFSSGDSTVIGQRMPTDNNTSTTKFTADKPLVGLLLYANTASLASVGWVTVDSKCVQNYETTSTSNPTTTTVTISKKTPFFKRKLFWILVVCGVGAALLLLIMHMCGILRCCLLKCY